MIQRLQSFFNLLMGVHEGEAMLRMQAHLIFARPDNWLVEMEVPAYLRRKSIVRVVSTGCDLHAVRFSNRGEKNATARQLHVPTQ